MGEPRAVLGALFALPMRAAFQSIHLGVAAARANNAFRPAAGDQIGDAMLFIGKHALELGAGELVNGLGALGSHRTISLSLEKDIALC